MKTLIALAMLLASCTPVQERFFTQEEDDAYRKMCEPAGCITLPIPQWIELMQRLRREQGREV
jgi:hypothetical protein